MTEDKDKNIDEEIIEEANAEPKKEAGASADSDNKKAENFFGLE